MNNHQMNILINKKGKQTNKMMGKLIIKNKLKMPFLVTSK